MLAPLYRPGLKDQAEWEWKKHRQKAFDKRKELLMSDKVVVHYNPDLPLTLACDSSAYGIGAVIQNAMPSGDEHPIAYASWMLAPAEKKFSD